MAALWASILKRLRCPACGSEGTIARVPDGPPVADDRDALLYRCAAMGCGFEGYDDEPDLTSAMERLGREGT
jgi:hypothetical protein